MAYELEGRVRQKQRTRAALVEAARALVAAGHTPTVEDAAEQAHISRTTAYRYFPNQRALLAEAHPEMTASSMLPTNPPTDPGERLALVIHAFTELIAKTEQQQRTMLKLSLDATPEQRAELPLRQGRAIGWILEALEPIAAQLGEQRLHQLVLALRSVTGIEALAWLRDVGGLSSPQALAIMRSNASAIYQAALRDEDPT